MLQSREGSSHAAALSRQDDWSRQLVNRLRWELFEEEESFAGLTRGSAASLESEPEFGGEANDLEARHELTFTPAWDETGLYPTGASSLAIGRGATRKVGSSRPQQPIPRSVGCPAVVAAGCPGL
jgi:hypothetical protein